MSNPHIIPPSHNSDIVRYIGGLAIIGERLSFDTKVQNEYTHKAPKFELTIWNLPRYGHVMLSHR